MPTYSPLCMLLVSLGFREQLKCQYIAAYTWRISTSALSDTASPESRAIVARITSKLSENGRLSKEYRMSSPLLVFRTRGCTRSHHNKCIRLCNGQLMLEGRIRWHSYNNYRFQYIMLLGFPLWLFTSLCSNAPASNKHHESLQTGLRIRARSLCVVMVYGLQHPYKHVSSVLERSCTNINPYAGSCSKLNYVNET
jgi:hypothetical protein